MATEIDADIFEYSEGGMRQCISGFGRNTINAIIAETRDEECHERLKWHVNELVRWCQHFNQKSQRVRKIADAAKALADTCEGRLPADSSDSVMVEAVHVMRINAALEEFAEAEIASRRAG